MGKLEVCEKEKLNIHCDFWRVCVDNIHILLTLRKNISNSKNSSFSILSLAKRFPTLVRIDPSASATLIYSV